MEHRTGFEPVSKRWQRRVLNPLDQRCVEESKVSSPGVQVCSANLTLDVGLWTNELVGEDRIELSPRVPRTRMLALHHTPEEEMMKAEG